MKTFTLPIIIIILSIITLIVTLTLPFLPSKSQNPNIITFKVISTALVDIKGLDDVTSYPHMNINKYSRDRLVYDKKIKELSIEIKGRSRMIFQNITLGGWPDGPAKAMSDLFKIFKKQTTLLNIWRASEKMTNTKVDIYGYTEKYVDHDLTVITVFYHSSSFECYKYLIKEKFSI